MAPKNDNLDEILDNEREWRRIIYADVQKIKEQAVAIKNDVEGLRAWNLVFRAAGATLFGLLFAYIKTVLDAYIKANLGG